MSIVRTTLPLENGAKFYYDSTYLHKISEEIETFLEWDKSMNNLDYARKMMFSHELKANNQVEGYSDDLILIEEIIKTHTEKIKNEEVRMRVLNLYQGYKYILEHHEIDDKYLQELYRVLSNGLLDEYSLNNMDIYRQKPVYILNNGRLDDSFDMGVSPDSIDELMQKYFEFVHTNIENSTPVDEYIKSQIMHFYFVYIHPFFDVNGRTSRTMAMGYLLEKQAYPFIIFNRGISFKGSTYDRTIRKVKLKRDITLFLYLMLDTLKVELEKEHIMQDIAKNTPYDLGAVEYQTLLYFLTMNGLRSAGDFARFYNLFNDKKSPLQIYNEMLVPLIDMGILEVIRSTKTTMGSTPNVVLELNSQKFDDNPLYLKRVKLK